MHRGTARDQRPLHLGQPLGGVLERLLKGRRPGRMPTSAVCSSSSNPPVPTSGSEPVLDRPPERRPDVGEGLVGAAFGEGLEPFQHHRRGVVGLGVGHEAVPVRREGAGVEVAGDVGPGLGVVQVQGAGLGDPGAGVGWSSPGPSCSRYSSTRLSSGAPCSSDRVSCSSSSSSRGLCLSLPRSKVSAPPVRYCFLAMASASSDLLMRDRPLTPSFLARSYSSCLVLPAASTPRRSWRSPCGPPCRPWPPGVGRALALLGLPVVALPLERVLHGRVGGAVGPLPLPVGLDGRVVGLAVGALGLGRGPLQGARQVLVAVLRHGRLLRIRSARCYPGQPGGKRAEPGPST